jgi:hypothetical protein
LIFLPGQEHIDTALELLTDAARSDDQRHHTALRLVPLPLYSALPPEEQLRVFEPLPKGHRKVRGGGRERTWWAHTGGGITLAIKQPTWPYDIERGPGGLTREVESPLPSNSPHGHMILREDLVGSHGRWNRPCLQTAHMAIWY